MSGDDDDGDGRFLSDWIWIQLMQYRHVDGYWVNVHATECVCIERIGNTKSLNELLSRPQFEANATYSIH